MSSTQPSFSTPVSQASPFLFEWGVGDFVRQQSAQFGANLEVESGLWAVFGVQAADAVAQEQARELLATANFAYESGETEDDSWTLYYVDSANRAAALHWLEDLHAQLDGRIRRASLRQR